MHSACAGGWFVLHRVQPNADRGAQVFATAFRPQQGLGPLYNGTACLDCHNTAPGGTGQDGLSTVLRFGQLSAAGFDPVLGRGGPVARAHSIAEFGASCDLVPGIPGGANMTSVRNPPALFGNGKLDAIPEAAILAGPIPRGEGILGRPNLVDGRVGRFGWKADTPTLEQLIGEAFRSELGLTNPIAPVDLVPPGACGGQTGAVMVDASTVADVVAYIESLPAPASSAADRSVFDAIGCSSCHVPNLGGVPLYSDLLLHDMGRALDDAVVQAGATGHDWRTAPLWGISHRARYLHDGRATSVQAAILAHGWEAEAATQRFRTLMPDAREALLAFLDTL